MPGWNDYGASYGNETCDCVICQIERRDYKDKIKEAVIKDTEEGTMINTFLVGCDPEFVALGQGERVINVREAWATRAERQEAEEYGDAEEDYESSIGSDHGGRVAELRPKPTKGTYALVKRLQRLIMSPRARKLIEKGAMKFRAGARGGGESLGGHVHLGMGINEIKNTNYERHVTTGQAIYDSNGNLIYKTISQVPDALDATTKLLEHLDILPRQESANRRQGNYGKFGDIRDSNGHVEYRTMASWLFDPKVAYLCLTSAKLAGADPKGTLESLKGVTSFEGMVKWYERYGHKDANARRALDNILCKGLKFVQIDPDVDFRGRWRELGI